MAGMISIGVGPETSILQRHASMTALFGPKCMKILVMGGTRFVGRPLVARLQAQGHALTLFTRGKNPVPAGVEHLCGDRSSDEGLSALKDRQFDVIVDSSGRKQEDSSRVVAITGAPQPSLCVREFSRGVRRFGAVAPG